MTTTMTFGKIGVGARMMRRGNFWTWPTEMVRQSADPTTIWTPRTGVWYSSVASNGYVRPTVDSRRKFNGYSFYNYTFGGYSLVQFLALPAGNYMLQYDCVPEYSVDSNTLFYLMPYEQSGSGYIKANNLNYELSKAQRDSYQTFTVNFSVPATVALIGIFISGLNIDGYRGCLVQNVWLEAVGA